MKKRFLQIPLVVVVACLLSSCYIPIRYDAEVVVDRRGYYEMFFSGYMAETDLYQGLRDGKIFPAGEQEKVAQMETDLTRDSATKVFKYIKQGFFELNWEKKGDLLKVGAVIFLRRNEDILSLKYVAKTGLVTLMGKSLSKTNIQRLKDIGLNSEGEIRFITNLKVVSSNATGSRPHEPRPGFTEYFWTIKQLGGPAPKIEAAF